MNQQLPTIISEKAHQQHKCGYCGKGFNKKTALTMHVIRMHTHKEESERAMRKSVRAKSIARNPSVAQLSRNEKQRRYNAEYRARNLARGLTTAGKPRKQRYHQKGSTEERIPFWKTREARRASYRKQRDKYWKMGLDARGNPFSGKPGRNAKYRGVPRTPGDRGLGRKERRSIKPFVFRKEDAVSNHVAENPGAQDTIRFCPHCGHNIEKYL